MQILHKSLRCYETVMNYCLTISKIQDTGCSLHQGFPNWGSRPLGGCVMMFRDRREYINFTQSTAKPTADDVEFFHRFLRTSKRQKQSFESKCVNEGKYIQVSFGTSLLIAKSKKLYNIGEIFFYQLQLK